jgi:hypothetical protein
MTRLRAKSRGRRRSSKVPAGFSIFQRSSPDKLPSSPIGTMDRGIVPIYEARRPTLGFDFDSDPPVNAVDRTGFILIVYFANYRTSQK